MGLFYVCQNKTQKQESNGQYLWSPQKTSNGKSNKGYTNMSKVKKGDIIFHGAKQCTYAISIAREDCYTAAQPEELKKEGKPPIWGENGYRIDSDYISLKRPLEMRPLFTWLRNSIKKIVLLQLMESVKKCILVSLI